MKNLLAVTLALLVVMFAALPASAQYPPGPGASATISDTTLAPGQTFTLTGSGWQSGSTVQFTFRDAVLGSATVRNDGMFSAPLTIPADTPPGSYVLVVSGTNADGTPRTVQIPVAITGAGAGAAVTTGGGLASTGLPLLVLVVFAAGALLFGGVAVRRSRTGS